MKFKTEVFLSIMVLSIGCNVRETPQDKLGDKLKGDKYFHAYMKCRTLFALKTLSNRYNTSDKVLSKLRANLQKAKTKTDIINSYKDAGITHPYEYWGYPHLIRMYITVLQGDYPELYKMSRNERELIYDEAASIAPADTEKLTDELITKSALQRRNKQ